MTESQETTLKFDPPVPEHLQGGMITIGEKHHCLVKEWSKRGDSAVIIPQKPEPVHQNIIHNMFGLSYAAYLVLPRSVMQSASPECQAKFKDAIEQLEREVGIPGTNYTVQPRGRDGKFTKDPFAPYRHNHVNADEVREYNDKLDE